ncbi:MAG: CvpA family protein [Actinomycetes bacterium]
MGHLVTIDYFLIGLLILVTLSGWRRGLIVTVMSLIGSIIGAFAGHFVATNLVSGSSHTTAIRWATEGFIFLIAVSLGNGVGGFVGKRINKALPWEPMQTLDHVSGGVLAFCGWALVIWIACTTLIAAPLPKIPAQLSDSAVVVKIDKYLPHQARTVIDKWRGMNSLALNLQKTAD